MLQKSVCGEGDWGVCVGGGGFEVLNMAHHLTFQFKNLKKKFPMLGGSPLMEKEKITVHIFIHKVFSKDIFLAIATLG